MEPTLDLEILDRAPSDWDEQLAASSGVVFHSRAWADYKVQESGGEPFYCLWREPRAGAVVGRALGLRRPSRGSLASRLAVRWAFDSPPAASGGGHDFAAALRSSAAGSPAVIEVGLGSYDARGEWCPEPLPNPRPRMEFVLPEGEPDEIWAGMRQLARRKVKKAGQAGLVCRRAADLKEIAAFADVYAVTVARLERDKGVDSGGGLNRERFATALDCLQRAGGGSLYAAHRDGRLEAGAVFATFADRAYMIHSGATDAGRDAGASFLVMSEALGDLRKRGHRFLNLGGAGGDAADPGSSEHGLYQFKTRFGASVAPCVSGTIVVRPRRAGAIAGLRRIVRR